jgi:hypothetical protein
VLALIPRGLLAPRGGLCGATEFGDTIRLIRRDDSGARRSVGPDCGRELAHRLTGRRRDLSC